MTNIVSNEEYKTKLENKNLMILFGNIVGEKWITNKYTDINGKIMSYDEIIALLYSSNQPRALFVEKNGNDENNIFIKCINN